MGIRAALVQFERESLERCGLDYAGLKWCELGNQRIGRKPAKEVYLSYGVEAHVAIDLNGKDGAMPLNLDDPVPFVFVDQFDVITNYGTSEHVNDQYHLFKNAHDMCRVDGIIINIVPREGHWPGHCRHYYTERFTQSLAEACGYEMVHIALLDQDYYTSPKNLIAFTYRKTEADFISPERFRAVEGLVDSGDTSRTGDYNKGSLKNKLRAVWAILREQ
jgi:SAM-dependent methyltransferase